MRCEQKTESAPIGMFVFCRSSEESDMTYLISCFTKSGLCFLEPNTQAFRPVVLCT